MHALFALLMWTIAGFGWLGFAYVGDWRGSVGGTLLAIAFVVLAVLYLGRPKNRSNK